MPSNNTIKAGVGGSSNSYYNNAVFPPTAVNSGTYGPMVPQPPPMAVAEDDDLESGPMSPSSSLLPRTRPNNARMGGDGSGAVNGAVENQEDYLEPRTSGGCSIDMWFLSFISWRNPLCHRRCSLKRSPAVVSLHSQPFGAL